MPARDTTTQNKQPHILDGEPTRIPTIKTQKTEPRVFAAALVIMWMVTFPVGIRALTNYSPGSTEFSHQTFALGENYWVVREKRSEGVCVGWMNIDLSTENDPRIDLSGQVKLSILNQNIHVTLKGESSLSKAMKLISFEGEIDAGKASVAIKSSEPPVDTMTIKIKTSENRRTLSLPVPEPVFFVEELPGVYSLRTPNVAKGVTLTPIENMLQMNIGELFAVSAADKEGFEACQNFMDSSSIFSLVEQPLRSQS